MFRMKMFILRGSVQKVKGQGNNAKCLNYYKILITI